MMSWGAEKTLRNSLESYANHGLLSTDEEKLILLQEGTRFQENVAASLGFIPITLPRNVGIAIGYGILVNAASEDNFLFLENDWELLRNPAIQFAGARAMQERYHVDVVRFRDRHNPGEPLWSKQFQGREYDAPQYLLDSLHWTDQRFPEIRPQWYTYGPGENDYEKWYITTSKNANWTNNPHMAKTQFLKDNILPRLGRGDLEKDIQSWWQEQEFKVAQSEGLFTHNRLD